MHNLTVTDVRAIAGDSAFLIDDGKTAILVDSGFGFTGDTVAAHVRDRRGVVDRRRQARVRQFSQADARAP